MLLPPINKKIKLKLQEKGHKYIISKNIIIFVFILIFFVNVPANQNTNINATNTENITTNQNKITENEIIEIPEKIQNTNNDGDKIIHKPFPETTKKMRKWGLVTLAIFGTSFLLIRSLYNSVKNINKFFAKGVLSLSNQMLLLFIFTEEFRFNIGFNAISLFEKSVLVLIFKLFFGIIVEVIKL